MRTIHARWVPAFGQKICMNLWVCESLSFLPTLTEYLSSCKGLSNICSQESTPAHHLISNSAARLWGWKVSLVSFFIFIKVLSKLQARTKSIPCLTFQMSTQTLPKQRTWSHSAGKQGQTVTRRFQGPVDTEVTSVHREHPPHADPLAAAGPAGENATSWLSGFSLLTLLFQPIFLISNSV